MSKVETWNKLFVNKKFKEYYDWNKSIQPECGDW